MTSTLQELDIYNQVKVPPWYQGFEMNFGPITLREAMGVRAGGIREAYRFVEIPEGLYDTLTRDDIRLLMPEAISRQILTLAENKRIGRNLLDTVRINSDSTSWLKEWGFEAREVTELSEIPIAKLRHEKLTMSTLMSGIGCRLSRAAIEDAQWDILRRHINQATLAMVKFEDAHIMSTIYSGVPDGTTIEGTRESDHSFAATGNKLDFDDLVRCITAIARENLEANAMVLHPYQTAQFLMAEQFRDSSDQYYFGVFPQRMENIMATGQIGTILGLNMFMSNNATAGTLLVLDTNNYAVFAERRPLRTEQDSDIIHQAEMVVLTQRFGTAILNNDGAANITGLQTAMP